MREKSLFESGEKDQRKLESLGGVQRHERDAGVGIELIGVGGERGVVEELGQRFAALLGVVRGVGQFLQVLNAAEGLGRALGFKSFDVAGAVDDESGSARAVWPSRRESGSRSDLPSGCLIDLPAWLILSVLVASASRNVLGLRHWRKVAGSGIGLVASDSRASSACRAEGKAGVGVVGCRFGHIGSELAGEVRIHHGLRVENELAERIERQQRARGDEAVGDGRGNRVPCGAAGFERQPLHGFKRGFADAAGRRVDDPLQRHGVVRIADEAEIGEQILDLGALVKAESAHHGVADVVAAQRFFNQPRLRSWCDRAPRNGAAAGVLQFRRSSPARAEMPESCRR